MFNKSIAYRLSIFISVAVISVFIVIIIISYLFNSRFINENINNKAIGLSNKLIAEIERPLVATREVSSNMSQQIIFYTQHKNPKKLIVNLMSNYPFINAVHIDFGADSLGLTNHNYYCYRNGDSIVFETHGQRFFHCLTEKRIIEKIALRDKPGWTEVYQCKPTGEMVVSAYSPVFLEGKNKKVGFVICEVSLKYLNGAINNIDVGVNSFAFLLSKDGRFITHPENSYVLKKSIFLVEDDAFNKQETNFKAILNKGLSGEFVAYPEFLNRAKHWVHYTRLKEIEWTVVFAIPYYMLFEPLYISILKMLLISVLGIIVIFLMIKLIISRLVEPLSEVTAQLKKFSSSSGNIEINSLNEIKLVSESLNYLKLWAKKVKIRQSEEESKNERFMQDLLQASEIQQSLIKTDFSVFDKVEEIDLYALYKPARTISGDLFDYFFLDGENLLFTMGDVSGKGIPAALFMSVAQTIIKNNASLTGAGKIIEKANNELHTTNQHQFFLTLFLGVLNIKTGVLDFCNAAHTPTYILKLNGEIVELAQSHGLPLGLYANKPYSSTRFTLEKGDSIILYTDGITELEDENKTQFGNEKFVENLRQLSGCSSEELVNRIDKSITIFRGEVAQIDDITLMSIKYK